MKKKTMKKKKDPSEMTEEEAIQEMKKAAKEVVKMVNDIWRQMELNNCLDRDKPK